MKFLQKNPGHSRMLLEYEWSFVHCDKNSDQKTSNLRIASTQTDFITNSLQGGHLQDLMMQSPEVNLEDPLKAEVNPEVPLKPEVNLEVHLRLEVNPEVLLRLVTNLEVPLKLEVNLEALLRLEVNPEILLKPEVNPEALLRLEA